MNNVGQVLFSATSVGGPGGSGLFVGSSASVAKVVANGDPNPNGGTFGSVTFGDMNNLGKVAFVASNSICVWTPGTGPGTGNAVVVSNGTAAPLQGGGVFSGFSTPSKFFNRIFYNDVGQIAFAANITGNMNPLTTTGLFRFEPGTPPTVDAIAFRGEFAPGSAETFSTFANSATTANPGMIINQNGLVSFQAFGSAGATLIDQQSGTNPPVAIATSAQPTGTTLAGTYVAPLLLGTSDAGATYFNSAVAGGLAYFGEFLGTASATRVLMNTSDTLPTGARPQFRTFSVGIGGNFISFSAQLGGGKAGVFVVNSSTGLTTKVCQEGDAAPFGVGEPLRCSSSVNYTAVNSSGTAVFGCFDITGIGGLCTWMPAGGLAKLLVTGDPQPAGISGTVSSAGVNALPPSAINSANQIVVFADNVAFYLMTPGSSPLKIVRVGDAAPGGGAFTAVRNASINALGQIAFTGVTSAGLTGIFVASTTVAPAKVVLQNDGSPGGGTFSAFSPPLLNDSGTVVFNATVIGGPSGVFTGTGTAAPLAVAVTGTSAPSGGNFNFVGNAPNILGYSLTAPNAVINAQGDIAFLAPLTTGGADSGVFLRRAADGVMRTVAIQGQAVPGASSVFSTFPSTLNLDPGENISIDPTGTVVVDDFVLTSTVRLDGCFRFRIDNTLERLIVRGDPAPQSDGGTFELNFQIIASGPVGQFAFEAGVGGGTFSDAIYLTQNPSPTLTTLSPTSTLVGQAVTPLTATGSDFVTGSTLRFNGLDHAGTVTNNGTTITANIAASELATGGTVPVLVANPSPGGGSSNSLNFTIGNPAAITSAASATFTIGAAGSFRVTTTGSPTPSLSVVGSLPSGLTFADNHDGTGTLAGIAAAGTAIGSYGITFFADNGAVPDAQQSFTLTVIQLESISVTPANPSLQKGLTLQFTATGTYSDASTRDITGSATWTTSKTSVATISTSGLATSAAQGTTTITATVVPNSGATRLTVAPPALESISVTPTNAFVFTSATKQFAATGTYSDGSTKTITSSVSWSSSVASVASISSGGLASGASTGTTTITAALGSVSGTAVLTVQPTLVSITIAPVNPSVKVGLTLQFAATGNYSDGSAQDLSNSVTWTSNKPGVATINSSGLATGVAKGNATIKVKLGGNTSSIVLSVTP
jgi:hypothetical protein